MNSLTITLALCLVAFTACAARETPNATTPPEPVVEAPAEQAVAPPAAPSPASLNAAPSAPRAADDLGDPHVAAAAELAELTALVRNAPEDERWPHWSNGLRDELPTLQECNDKHPVIQASARLALFETRFGLRAEDLAGWTELRAASEHALNVFLERTAKHTHASPARVWTRATLEFISGDADAARTTLLGDHPRTYDGDCEYHLSQSMYWLAAARAVVLDLIGDTDTALLWYHTATYWYWDDLSGALIFSHHRVVCDLVLARYAEHLLVVDPDAAALVVLALKKHWSGLLGARIAERVIRPRLRGEPPEGIRLFALRDPENDGWYDPTKYLVLLGDPARRTEARVLAGVVAYEAPPGATQINPDWDVDSAGPDDPRLRVTLERLAKQSETFHDYGHLLQKAGW